MVDRDLRKKSPKTLLPNRGGWRCNPASGGYREGSHYVSTTCLRQLRLLLHVGSGAASPRQPSSRKPLSEAALLLEIAPARPVLRQEEIVQEVGGVGGEELRRGDCVRAVTSPQTLPVSVAPVSAPLAAKLAAVAPVDVAHRGKVSGQRQVIWSVVKTSWSGPVRKASSAPAMAARLQRVYLRRGVAGQQGCRGVAVCRDAQRVVAVGSAADFREQAPKL